jgi:hypothetical protein
VGSDWAVPSYECARYGSFQVNDIPTGWLTVQSPEQMVKASGWVGDQNAAGVEPVITKDNLEQVFRIPLPSYHERARRALKAFASFYPDLQTWSNPEEFCSILSVQGASYSANGRDVSKLVSVLVHSNALRENNGLIALSVEGLLLIEEMGTKNTAALQAFVAMDFSPTMNSAWTGGFYPGLRNAGFEPLRIDGKDYVGGITDQIMAEIRRSRFVVVDYTGQKAGVYFEAGFALGLGLTVIPTCRADEISNLHFDIRHLNTLAWDTPETLATALTTRVKAVLAHS